MIVAFTSVAPHTAFHAEWLPLVLVLALAAGACCRISSSAGGIGAFALLCGIAAGCVAYQSSGQSVMAGVFAGLGGAFIGALLTNLLLFGPMVMAVFVIPGVAIGAIVRSTTNADWGVVALAGVGASVLAGFLLGWLAGWARKFPGDVDETMPAADAIGREIKANRQAAGDAHETRGEFGGPFAGKRGAAKK